MVRFYFHLQTSELTRDDEGSFHSGLAAAKRHALNLMSEFLERRPESFWAAGKCAVRVTDDTGATVFTAAVEAVLPAAVTLLARKLWT
jgi:hypothetical protein